MKQPYLEMNTWRKAGVAPGCDSSFSPRGGSLILPCGKNGKNVCVYHISRVYVGPDITVRSAVESLTNQNWLVTLLWYNFLFFEGLYQKQILCLSSFMRSARSQQRHHCWQKPPCIVDQFKVEKKETNYSVIRQILLVNKSKFYSFCCFTNHTTPCSSCWFTFQSLGLSYWSWMLESFFGATGPWRTLIQEESSEKIFELIEADQSSNPAEHRVTEGALEGLDHTTRSVFADTTETGKHSAKPISLHFSQFPNFPKTFPNVLFAFFPNLLIKCVKSFAKKSKWLKLNTVELHEEQARICNRAVEVIVGEITSPTIWKDKYHCVVHRRERLKVFSQD